MKAESDKTIVADADRRALLQASVAGIAAALLTTPNAGAQERGTRVLAEAFAQVHHRQFGTAENYFGWPTTCIRRR